MAKKTNETQDQFDQIDGSEPRVYELGFHLDPELPQEEVKKAYQTIRDRVAAAGTVVAEGEPVKIPLAYTISRKDTTGRRDFNSAFFCWIAYETDGAGHEQIATAARENPQIVRHLDIRTTVDEAKHSAEMQEMFAQMASQPMEGDELAETPEAVEQPAEPAPSAAEEPAVAAAEEAA
jgi:ribosomal protein S6